MRVAEQDKIIEKARKKEVPLPDYQGVTPARANPYHIYTDDYTPHDGEYDEAYGPSRK